MALRMGMRNDVKAVLLSVYLPVNAGNRALFFIKPAAPCSLPCISLRGVLPDRHWLWKENPKTRRLSLSRNALKLRGVLSLILEKRARLLRNSRDEKKRFSGKKTENDGIKTRNIADSRFDYENSENGAKCSVPDLNHAFVKPLHPTHFFGRLRPGWRVPDIDGC